MALRAIIVDDEPPAVRALEELCARTGRIEVVGAAADGEAALSLAQSLRPDAVFLDIGMPGLTGLAVAGRLSATAAPPLVVFVTAYDHYATEAFDLAVVDYVLKPIDAQRLDRAIERLATLAAHRGADKAAPERAEEFWAPSRGGMVRIPTEAIRRVDAERDYVRLWVETTSYLLRQPISAIEARLKPSLFIRIHRSTLMRRDSIRELRRGSSGAWVAVDADGRMATIGRSYLAKVRLELGLVLEPLR